MKVWKEFNSSHSSDISIVGVFENIDTATKAYNMIEDFTLGAWEERYPSLDEFNTAWSSSFHPDVKYIGIFKDEFELGIDNAPDIEMVDNEIRISSLRNNNIGGIIKLMRFAGANKITVE